jgi:hypothetical protein
MVLAGASEIGISADQSEAIAFFLFFNLLIGINLHTVFQQLVMMISYAVRLFDNHFPDHLFNELKIRPIDFCFSWVSLVFAQSLELKELLRLWDHVLIFNQVWLIL